ncbi:MAG: hypothetical protein R2737_15010 [Candidatus Nanopelagicales bacterium]
MSKTQTSSRKRLIALGSAVALGAGILVPLAAGPASAAAVYTASGPSAVRAALPTSTTPVSITSTEALSTATTPASYGLVYVSSTTAGATVNGLGLGQPVGNRVQPANDAMSADIGPALTFSAVGDYTLGVCRDAIPPIGLTGCDPTDPIVAYVSIKAGGQIASFSVVPSSASVPDNTTFPVTLSYKDPAGTPTLPNGFDTVSVSWTVNGGSATVNQLTPLVVPMTSGDPLEAGVTTMTVRVAQGGASPANAVFTFTPSNNTVPTVQAVYNTVPRVVNLAADLTNSSDIVLAAGNCAVVNVGCDYFANPTVTKFNVTATGTPNGGTAFVSYPADAGLTVTGPSTVTLGATGTASFEVTVQGATSGRAFDVLFSYGPTPTNFSLGVIYQAPAPADMVINPPDTSVVFAAAGGNVPVDVQVFDQYGNLFTGGAFATLFRTTGGPAVPIASISLPSGSGSMSTTATSATATQDTFDVIAYATGGAFDTDSFTVRYGVTPTLTVVSGVTTTTATVKTVVPGNGKVENPTAVSGPVANTWTPVGVQVSVNGIVVPNAFVSFSGSEGVGFASSNGMAVTSGAKTGGALANAAGVATATAYSTKTGTATVNAAAGSGTASGSWTVVTDPDFARDLAVDPATGSAKVGGAQKVTVTAKDGFGNGVAGAFVNGSITGVGRFLYSGNSLLTGFVTSTDGIGMVEVSTLPSEEGTSTATFELFGAQAGDAANVPAGSGFAASSPSGESKLAWTSGGAVQIVSPAQGSAISSGGYFGVSATSSLAEGTEVFLTLDGRAKAKTTVQANGNIRFEKIPAQPGNYAVRYGEAGSYMYSNEVSLDIRLFSITRFQENVSGDTDNFQIATGNWSRGTTINLTRNGISVAAVKVGAPGQPVAVKLVAKPGTYQVRVNSNQGYVYGDANGQVVIK